MHGTNCCRMENYISVKSASLVYLNNDYATIYLHQELSLLILEWKRQINLSERIEAFLKGLELTQKYQIKNWLTDAQQTFFITQEEKNWILENWIPLITKTQLQKLAVVYSENYNSLMTYTEFTQKGKELYLKSGIIENEAFINPDFDTDCLLQLNSN